MSEIFNREPRAEPTPPADKRFSARRIALELLAELRGIHVSIKGLRDDVEELGVRLTEKVEKLSAFERELIEEQSRPTPPPPEASS